MNSINRSTLIYVFGEGEKTEKEYCDRLNYLFLPYHIKYYPIKCSGKSIKPLENALKKEKQNTKNKYKMFLCYDIDNKKDKELDNAILVAKDNLCSNRQFEYFLDLHKKDDIPLKEYTDEEKDILCDKISEFSKEQIIKASSIRNNIDIRYPFCTFYNLIDIINNVK